MESFGMLQHEKDKAHRHIRRPAKSTSLKPKTQASCIGMVPKEFLGVIWKLQGCIDVVGSMTLTSLLMLKKDKL